MHRGSDRRATLPETIRSDRATGLPLADEQDVLFERVRAYLQLPFSVAEHGCGKKANIVLEQLVQAGVPVWALRRGMILERDMSPVALSRKEPSERSHRLLVPNPLYTLADLNDPTLQAMLAEEHMDVRVRHKRVEAGRYRLHFEPNVQFVHGRSHIFVIITFWDDETRSPVDRVFDPTLRRDGPFEVDSIREICDAPEALLFEAFLGARFHLAPQRLTEAQRDEVNEIFTSDRALEELSETEHAALIRKLNGAARESIGDPATWTYANNVDGETLFGALEPQDRRQRAETGIGDDIGPLRERLLEARTASDTAAVRQHRRALDRLIDGKDIERQIRRDAAWSEQHLAPLARMAITLVYHDALRCLAHVLGRGDSLLDHLSNPIEIPKLRGLGVHQRHRIDQLAVVSQDEEGRIDARALNERYIACARATIAQMNRAGLSVCVDRVGNIHGLRLKEAARRRLKSGEVRISDLATSAVMVGSHIDTVNDAGRFDGRLGVTAGIEAAQVIRDLSHHHGVELVEPEGSVLLIVTAFVGEEMTFTGEGVSMPGSAAVAGRASVEQVHRMKNADGDRFVDRLQVMLESLQAAEASGEMSLVNDFARRPDELLDACYEPTAFFTSHFLERHIEQGPILDRAGVPAALVDAIVGIHQEDFYLVGGRAEAAALELDVRLRELCRKDYPDARVTVGIVEPSSESVMHPSQAAFHCVLTGEANHAGATPLFDRRDAGVAAGRLVRAAAEWLEDQTGDLELPLVGDVRFEPGTNRNVIPGCVSLTIALATGHHCEDDVDDLQRALRGFAEGPLARHVTRQGEGLVTSEVIPASFVKTATSARLTLDLRDAARDDIEAIAVEVSAMCRALAASHDVDIRREVVQQLDPQNVEDSGQSLLLERSYGGSHNPHELERTEDLTQAGVLQLSVLRDVLNRETLDGVRLVDVTERHLPRRWCQKQRRVVSGALHDTCNISARATATPSG